MHSNPSEFLSVEFFLSTFFVEFYLLSGAPDFSYFFLLILCGHRGPLQSPNLLLLLEQPAESCRELTLPLDIVRSYTSQGKGTLK